MATNSFSVSHVGIQQFSQPEGHDIRYDFSLYNPAALQVWNFKRFYLVPCLKSPTSWKFTTTLYRDSNTGMIIGDAILERKDSLNVPVSAHFVLTFYHNDFSLDFTPESEARRGIQRGQIKRSYIHTIVPNDLKHLLQGEILVSIHISVRNCHPEIVKGPYNPGGGSGAGAQWNQMRFSKL